MAMRSLPRKEWPDYFGAFAHEKDRSGRVDYAVLRLAPGISGGPLKKSVSRSTASPMTRRTTCWRSSTATAPVRSSSSSDGGGSAAAPIPCPVRPAMLSIRTVLFPTDREARSQHERTGLARMFLGSVAEETVSKAPCPVFVVKPAGKSLLAGLKDAEPASSVGSPV